MAKSDNGKKVKGDGKQRNNSEALAKARWKPGQCGNPKGRPRGPSFTARAMRHLEQQTVTMKDGRTLTLFDLLVEQTCAKAAKGDAKLLKLLLERIDPAQRRVKLDAMVEPEQVHEWLDRLRITTKLPGRSSGNGNGRRKGG